ncbi:MarR family winged helix-turn-helix transcriptional regulator [Nocardioides sp. Soil805]|uniref:MarR family winged helix-turn-helix transcriptional regulator n=1 Tax=Nocardioides sp. Soil805 TaxID=1736416 RepID=UPI00070388E7|nr:MarR family transcriptional regulator [Nocardioides sp. Soil805]KRF37548.1 MarR family transcriptional regulator [Nocardioides sp. Soil805]
MLDPRTEVDPAPPDAPASAFADAWQQTGSLDALREFADAAARMRPIVARQAGLSESELSALEHLVREPLGPAELSRLLEVSTAAGTGIVDRLASHGHVTREPHAGDRRRTRVMVTASGREEVLMRLMPMFTSLQRLDASFTDDERAVVERYLRGAREAFRAVTAPPA